jgi:two-component system response regulator AtoC
MALAEAFEIMPDILIIEDDENIRFLLGEEFSLDGFNVRMAQNGQAGLDALADQRPDIVLLDLMMPGIPGEEVLRQIKAQQPRLPVVIYTAYADRREAVLALGADDFFLKTGENDEMIHRARELADSHS